MSIAKFTDEHVIRQLKKGEYFIVPDSELKRAAQLEFIAQEESKGIMIGKIMVHMIYDIKKLRKLVYGK